MENKFKQFGTLLTRGEAKKIRGGALEDGCKRFTCSCGSTSFSTCTTGIPELAQIANSICAESATCLPV
jgi:hypothetical protein